MAASTGVRNTNTATTNLPTKRGVVVVVYIKFSITFYSGGHVQQSGHLTAADDDGDSETN